MALRLKRRINWDKRIGVDTKPKRMHWKTMLKIIQRKKKYDEFAMQGNLRLMEMFFRRLDGWKAKRERRKANSAAFDYKCENSSKTRTATKTATKFEFHNKKCLMNNRNSLIIMEPMTGAEPATY